MTLKKNSISKILFLFTILSFFIIGFFFKDLAPGGAAGDFQNITWPLLLSFKEDFFFSIKNYGAFGEGSYPLFYIINSYINPFTSTQTEFLFSITFISFITVVLLALLIKKNISTITNLDSLLTASIILILPFYISSSYWGTTENFGWFFFILSLLFFNKIKNNLDNNYKSRILSTIYFCFFSSCALYIRPALVFLPIAFFLYLFLVNKKKEIIITSIITYLIFSIPGFILIYIWGDIYDSKNMTMNLTEEYHNYKFIIKNIPILLSFFSFYLIPFLLVESLEKGLKNTISKYLKNFLFAFFFFIILWKFDLLNYLAEFTYGGGAILKLNYLIKPENYFLLLIFSSLGFSILYEILKENFKTNISILLPIFLIYGFSGMLFQEYVEPLILIITFSGLLSTSLQKFYYKRILTSFLIMFTYFSFYLIAATYYKHFI